MPIAAQLLLPVWGYQFVRPFLDATLPTLLAPGNVPTLAGKLASEFIILTSEEDEPFIRLHPTFRALSDICPTEIRLIDHLITGMNYSTTLTLAYTEAVRATGPAMLDTCFLFLLSDYIMADGSLAHVGARMMEGASAVLAGNFQVALESAFPWLQAKLSRATPALALTSLEMMRWGLAHLHPITVANTVNFPLNHNRHTNRLFWRADGQTLVGRFYLMHPIAVRPETMDFVIGASCDYSFIPEMCPSGNVDVITNSDEYLVVEMQPYDHERAFLRPGPLRPRALARTLSEWTTEHHRLNAHHSVIFHASDLPETLGATIAVSDRFIARVERLMRRPPKPHRGHPYWHGALAAHRNATGKRLRLHEQWLALGLPEDFLMRFQHPFERWRLETVVSGALGRPPLMRPWHPRWVDRALAIEYLRKFTHNPQQRLLMVADRPTLFTASLADGGERAVSLHKTPFLESRQEIHESLVRSFDLCLVELEDEERAQGDELVDRIVPLMKPGGKILMRVQHPVGRWLLEAVVFAALGRPPLMRPWHPRWADHELAMQHLRKFMHDPQQRLLMVADRPTVFTVSLADSGERAVSLRKTPFLESRQEIYEPLVHSFDLCLVELDEEELAQGDELVDRIVPLMKPGGQILIVVYNRRTKDAASFAASIGIHATRLMRAGATLSEVRVVPASRFRWLVSRAIASLAVTAYHRPWVGFPLLALSGGFLALGSLLANAAARGRSVGTLRPRKLATSIHIMLNVDGAGQDAFRYAATPILRQLSRQRLGVGEDPVRTTILTRRTDTTPILRGVRWSGGAQDSPAQSDGQASVRPLTRIPITRDSLANNDKTREPQYERTVDLRNQIGLTPLGLMTNQVWHDDPRRLGILLSRYKFVAKMLSGRRDVGEVGCGDAFGTRVVLQEVDKVTVYDFDPIFIADIRQRFSDRWPITAHLHDILADRLPRQHDALYTLDVLEHIARQDEHVYLANLRASLTDDGVLIIGSPSFESQSYASPQSAAGHVNCKSGAEMKALLGNFFKNVFLFSMNDEVVHTGFYPMAHYLLAVCCGKK